MSFGKAKAPPGEPSGAFVLATSYSRTTYRRTTIGAAAFHFRVRNGNGWCHCAMITRVRNRTGGFAAFAATQARSRPLLMTIGGNRHGRSVNGRCLTFRKNTISDIKPQTSEIKLHLTGSLKSTYRGWEQHLRASFYFEIIRLLCLRPRIASGQR